MNVVPYEKTICFIFCVNNEEEFSKALKYIKELDIPDGYSIDIIPVRNAESMCSGYNFAMKKSKAKYRVYLHQNVCILNKNFILDVIDLFKKHTELGMIGVAGASKLTESAIWWEGLQNYGEVIEERNGNLNLLKFNEVEEEYKNVQAIDGLIMITQYDLMWREDVFKGWHFYDISQCMEFIKAGYTVGIPKQVETWCEHGWGVDCNWEDYNEARLLFLHEYEKELAKLNR